MAEPRRSSRQRSLVEMLAPPKRKAGDGDGELDAPAARSKRVTMGVKAEDSIKDEETSAAVKHEDASAPGSSSRPALDAPLVPVTRREFVERYRVEGLGGAEVYYMCVARLCIAEALLTCVPDAGPTGSTKRRQSAGASSLTRCRSGTGAWSR
jgi:hypothetical protein